MIRFVAWTEAIAKLYSKKNRHFQTTGQRLLPKETVDERMKICQFCEEFTGKTCKLCGCCTSGKESHFNKLAFPTEACPANKWEVVE